MAKAEYRLLGILLDENQNKTEVLVSIKGKHCISTVKDTIDAINSGIEMEHAIVKDNELFISTSHLKTDLSNKTINDWTVLEFLGLDRKDNKEKYWLCKCSCGTLRAVNHKSLINGESRGCGHNTTSFKDISNTQINDWTVLDYAGDGYWNCICSCNTRCKVKGSKLRSGKSRSCGHDTNKQVDLSGMTIGEWYVKDYKGNDMWECECSCGTIKNVSGHSLKRGMSLSCGHDTSGFKDLTGQTIFDWTVLKYAGNRKWLCRCSCGNVQLVNGGTLNNGTSKSCGHDTAKLIDLTDNQFGELTVKSYLGNRKWLCECSCGNKTTAYGYALRKGLKQSCGHIKTDIPYPYDSAENFAMYLLDLQRTLNRLPRIKDISDDLPLCKTSVLKYIHKYSLEDFVAVSDFSSVFETDVYDFLVANNINVEFHNRSLIAPYELDIYLPDYHIAIECNGTYWHSEAKKDKNYHINKTKLCQTKGIRLIHIFEYEWQDEKQQDKIKNYILSLINTSTQIYARNTQLKVITNEVANEFIQTNHLQGISNHKIALGLYYEDILMEVMTFGAPRFNSDYSYEIHRLCTRTGYSVTGGAGKLFKYFINNYVKEGQSVISYCDLSKFTGKVYEQIGMILDHISAPNYVYATNDGQVLTRYQCMKHKLVAQGYSNELSETAIMEERGFHKIYDCGNAVYTYTKKGETDDFH